VDTDRLEVIDAFVDGRRVDAADLKDALADERGRGYFVDAWLLRETLQEEMARETIPLPRRAPGRTPGMMLAVAAALASLVAGGAVGYRLAGLADSRARMETAITAPAPVPPAPPAPSFPVPAPTRAIPMEFSADGGVGGGD
jgi:hypothetical protein